MRKGPSIDKLSPEFCHRYGYRLRAEGEPLPDAVINAPERNP